MQYTCPDLMYAVNRLSSHASEPSASDFQVINNLIHYLDVWVNRTIMYPGGIDGTTNHDLRKEV